MGFILLIIGLVGLAVVFPPMWFVYLVIVGWLLIPSRR